MGSRPLGWAVGALVAFAAGDGLGQQPALAGAWTSVNGTSIPTYSMTTGEWMGQQTQIAGLNYVFLPDGSYRAVYASRAESPAGGVVYYGWESGQYALAGDVLTLQPAVAVRTDNAGRSIDPPPRSYDVGFDGPDALVLFGWCAEWQSDAWCADGIGGGYRAVRSEQRFYRTALE
ncbi:MAG: hypothetical protein R3F55_16815 [Alphaproteobacteria bacterium]